MSEIRDKRHAAWFWMDKSIIDTYGPRIGPHGIALYAALARHANAKGQSFPSMTALAKLLGCSRRTVIRTLQQLMREELIVKTARSTEHGDWNSNIYTLLTVGGSDSQSPPSDSQSPPSDSQTLRVVTHRHYPSDSQSHEQELLEQELIKQEYRTTSLSDNETIRPNSPPADPVKISTPKDLMALYNETVPSGIPKAGRLSDARKKKAAQYIRQFPDRDFWVTVFSAPERSSFLRGEKPSNGHEYFRMSFDWLLSKGKDGTENCVKVYEGRYDDITPEAQEKQRICEAEETRRRSLDPHYDHNVINDQYRGWHCFTCHESVPPRQVSGSQK